MAFWQNPICGSEAMRRRQRKKEEKGEKEDVRPIEDIIDEDGIGNRILHGGRWQKQCTSVVILSHMSI